jgi:hypothetical protein
VPDKGVIAPELPDKSPREPVRPAPPVVEPDPAGVDPPKPPRPKEPDPQPAPVTPTLTPKARPPHPFPPPKEVEWVSPWEKTGDVRVRVCGAGVTKVPLERRKTPILSPEPYFVVWVEIENASTTARRYNRWQPVTTGECTLRYASGAALPYAILPPDTGREWFSEFSQPIPPGGPPLLESLVFSRPDRNAEGAMTLTLDATRVGATGRFTLAIPHNVWARP